jgi:protein tyrosine phosphatase (PTP) superfamily phosphohydrolase (DUF442 family)
LRIVSVLSIVCLFFGSFGVRSGDVFADSKQALELLKAKVIHFDEAMPAVYRSGLVPKEDVPLLKELGLKTVINFDNNDKRAEKEVEYLKRFGIYSVRIPWSGWGYPKEEDINKFLTLMKAPDLKPVLVHCKRGSERTGTAMAIWRIDEFGWPAKKAYEEMKRYEYRSFRQGHLKKYVFQFAREHGEKEARIGNPLELLKTNFLYFLFQLRKLTPFRSYEV